MVRYFNHVRQSDEFCKSKLKRNIEGGDTLHYNIMSDDGEIDVESDDVSEMTGNSKVSKISVN